VVIGAFRSETQEFKYDILDVKYFRPPRFRSKEYLKQASKIVFQLLNKLEIREDEQIQVCRGYIFDEAVDHLREKYGSNRVNRITVTGEPQRLTEIAYLDEIRNLGYEPVKERDEKKAELLPHDELAQEKPRKTDLRKDWLATPAEIQFIQVLPSEATKRTIKKLVLDYTKCSSVARD